MTLKWRLLLPVTAVGVALSAYAAWGWLPDVLSAADRDVIAGTTLALLLIMQSVAALALDRRVRRPLAALIHPRSTGAPEDGTSSDGDEIEGIARTIAALEQNVRKQQAELEQGMQRRKQLEAALQLSEERYALAVRSSSDGLWEWNLETGDMHLSPRWKSMLGYSDEELRGGRERWLRCVHPDDLAAVERALRAHLEGERD